LWAIQLTNTLTNTQRKKGDERGGRGGRVEVKRERREKREKREKRVRGESKIIHPSLSRVTG